MRTTIDIDEPILKELKELQKTERKSLGRIVSDLVAQALGERRVSRKPRKPAKWHAEPMGALVDLADREAIHALMDQEHGSSESTPEP